MQTIGIFTVNNLDKIFTEMDDVPFNDNVWPLFLGENAKKVLKL